MTIQEIIEVLKTQPYRRVCGYTVDFRGCLCATGALLKSQGWQPVESYPGSMYYLENTWRKGEGEPESIGGAGKIAETLSISLTLAEHILTLSDVTGLSGPEIAEALHDEQGDWT